jgi:hypothetical protein
VRAAQYRDAGLIVSVRAAGDLGGRSSAFAGTLEISPLPVFVVKRTRAGTPRIEASGQIASV